MSQLGSLEWSRRSAGRLTARERFGIVVAGLAMRLRRLRAANAASASDDGPPFDALPFPDSAAVRETLALCESAYEPYLLNHCLRTYAWGGLVARRERLKVDHEELFVAALLHDIGLTAAAQAEPACDCFAVRGGLFAEAYLRASGHAGLAAAVPQSICMHLNLAVSPANPLEYLLHQGASIDVVGWDLYKVKAAKQEVLRRYPREAFKARICAALAQEVQRYPGTRPALMVRVGFLDLIRSAPYEE